MYGVLPTLFILLVIPVRGQFGGFLRADLSSNCSSRHFIEDGLSPIPSSRMLANLAPRRLNGPGSSSLCSTTAPSGASWATRTSCVCALHFDHGVEKACSAAASFLLARLPSLGCASFFVLSFDGFSRRGVTSCRGAPPAGPSSTGSAVGRVSRLRLRTTSCSTPRMCPCHLAWQCGAHVVFLLFPVLSPVVFFFFLEGVFSEIAWFLVKKPQTFHLDTGNNGGRGPNRSSNAFRSNPSCEEGRLLFSLRRHAGSNAVMWLALEVLRVVDSFRSYRYAVHGSFSSFLIG